MVEEDMRQILKNMVEEDKRLVKKKFGNKYV